MNSVKVGWGKKETRNKNFLKSKAWEGGLGGGGGYSSSKITFCFLLSAGCDSIKEIGISPVLMGGHTRQLPMGPHVANTVSVTFFFL